MNDSTWKWSNGRIFDYDNWNVGEPDNLGGNQDKIQLNHEIVGGWDDLNGKEKKYFICERMPKGN